MKKNFSSNLYLLLMLAATVSYASANTVVEASLVRVEFYEASGQHAIVFQHCIECPLQTIRIDPNARVLLNGELKNISEIFESRHKLKRGFSFTSSKATGVINWVSVKMEKSL